MSDELVPTIDWNAIAEALGDDEDFWLKLKAIEALAFHLPVPRIARELGVPSKKIREWMDTQSFRLAQAVLQQNIQQYLQNDLAYFHAKAFQHVDQVLSFDPFAKETGDTKPLTDRMKETLLREKGLIVRMLLQGFQEKKQDSGVPQPSTNLDESAEALLAEALKQGRVQVVKEITPEIEKQTPDE